MSINLDADRVKLQKIFVEIVDVEVEVMICTGCTAGMPPQMSLASEEPYSMIPRRQLHPGFSGIRDNVNP